MMLVRILDALPMVSDASMQGATVRTTLDVDRKLLDEVVKATGERSKSAAVNKVLSDYVRRKRVDELREIAGNIDLVNNLRELEALELREYQDEVNL
jgi:Arc/MetJ family transcription regulator